MSLELTTHLSSKKELAKPGNHFKRSFRRPKARDSTLRDFPASQFFYRIRSWATSALPASQATLGKSMATHVGPHQRREELPWGDRESAIIAIVTFCISLILISRTPDLWAILIPESWRFLQSFEINSHVQSISILRSQLEP